ncbi:hypothetical protein CVT24_005610 [Panaeolus cyanescens]|uniref:Uncharacterized protein n=1 Tax=Panaeolus cyanescens TaxID=181874 RepID=A0A409YXZ6_9AGAR|nr:hypothetical protein CVT24_005610 [Panaeolus cyanescens]
MTSPTVTTSQTPSANWRSSVISSASNATSSLRHEPRLVDWLRIPGLTLSEEDMLDVQSLIEEYEDQLSQLVSNPVKKPTGLRKVAKGVFVGRYRRWIVKLIPKGHSESNESDSTKESLQRSIDALRSLSAPIRRLPPELLSEIFTHCLPPNPFNKPSPLKAPLLLAQVCGFWRDVAIATPQLWASLAMTRVDKPPCHKSTMGVLRTWLTRSADRPLWVSFHADAFPYGALDEVLNDFHDHFEHIRLTMGYQSHPVIHQNKRFPLLKHFDIRTPYELPSAVEARFASALATATSLQSFTWINTTRIPSLRPPPFGVNWGTLTRLILHSPLDTRTILSILTEANLLQYLAVNNLMGGGYSPSMITLPHLTQIVIDTLSFADALLNSLTVPNLKDLLLNIRTWEHRSVISLLQRSQCPLESCNVYFADITETQMIEILKLAQHTLKEFTIQSEPDDPYARPFGDAIAEALTYPDEGDALCPNLDTIAIYDCISCSSDKLERMLLSRSEKVLRSNVERQKGLETDTINEQIGAIALSDRRPLRLLQTYDCPEIQTSLQTIRDSGLLVRLFSKENQSLMMSPEDEEKLNRLVAKEGLLVRLYEPTSGYFDVPEEFW